MDWRNTFGIKFTKFGSKYLTLGISLFLSLMLVGNLLPQIVTDSVIVELFMVIAVSYILLYIGIKIYEERKKLKGNQTTKNQLIIKYIILSSLVLFIGLVLGYHKTGPRGATNDCYNDFKFVSCEKQTSVYGNTVYTCLRSGKKSIVNCNADECRAVCER